jgi:hypothetical protein
MSSTVIGNATWSSTGLVLSQQTVQEQVTGLVNVQVTYVCPAAKQHTLARSFYLDAPPPIFPSVITRAELLTNNLYMTTRTVERLNGLCYIRAEYAGGLRRAGFRGYFQRETLEHRKSAFGYNYAGVGGVFSTITGSTGEISYMSITDASGMLRRVRQPITFRYDERIQQLSFVRIGQEQAVSLPVFYRGDLVSLAPTRNASAASFDLWSIPGAILNYEKNTPVQATESSEYITPRVQVITLAYRLGN